MSRHPADEAFARTTVPPPGTFWATQLENRSTSLDPAETPTPASPISTFEDLRQAEQLCSNFRHSGWMQQRRRIYEAFRRTGHPHGVVSRFARCGLHAWVYQSLEHPDRYRVAGSFCRSRWCQPCQLQRSRLIAANLTELVAGKRTRFLTLTVAHNHRPLAEQLDKLTRDFQRLRNSAWWKSKVWCGAWFLEVAWNPRLQQWHPHLHCLVQGLYLRQSELKAHWYRITGDSYIIHIEFVQSETHCHKYVTKYASKALGVRPDMPQRILDELIITMRGRRLCGTWGKWKNVNLLQTEVDPDTWIYVARLDELLLSARNGDLHARAVIDSLPGPDCDEVATIDRPRSPPAEALTYAECFPPSEAHPYLED